VTIGSATANLLLTDSNTKILHNPRIRCTDGQKATMKIGEKIPVATGSYQTGTHHQRSVSSLVNTQFQYQDVGVNIEVTPTVHFDHDVTLKIKLEDTFGEQFSDHQRRGSEPIISQTHQRAGHPPARGRGQHPERHDEQPRIRSSWTGIPGLSSIPGLKYLFGSKDHTITDDEIVFLVVPHVVRSQYLEQVNLRTVDTGVGTSIEIRRVPVEVRQLESRRSQLPSASAAPARPEVGTFPGQSAGAAGPAALAQLRQTAETEWKLPAPPRRSSSATGGK
jgi:general secretion pathway protein D